uniref:BAH domain-containing protein n=1 Tax=Syphacia muris TaxID=451379 RepID=A0A0N5ACT7_9BILA
MLLAYEVLANHLRVGISYSIAGDKVEISEYGDFYYYDLDECLKFFDSLECRAELDGSETYYYLQINNPVDERKQTPLSVFCYNLRTSSFK